MEVYTIGFTQKNAREFFGALEKAGIRRLVDIRLNNRGQLAGFTKEEDLKFFLERICKAEYVHELLLAPTDEMLGAYRKKAMSWAEYEARFIELMTQRQVEAKLTPELFNVPTVLLCSELRPTQCHRRLVVEYLQSKWKDLKAVHL